ncbi:MAG TPA: DUF1499 domain-containing protein [Steroidobacteraceae bacterium]
MSGRFPSLQPAAWPARSMRVGLWLIVMGLVLAGVSGPLHRFHMLGPGPALMMLAVGLLLLVVGALLAIVGLLGGASNRAAVPRWQVAAAIVIALVVIGYLLSWVRAGLGVPPINEVSTDLTNPPPFVAIRAIREAIPGTNSTDYVAQVPGRSGMIDVPTKQRAAYPDLQPLLLELTPAQAFTRAESAARALGWDIVAAVPEEGRLEATASTRFFGFKDDVVIRLRAEGAGTRVDVRSKSRVGLGDAGTNAARVRKFLARIKT